MSKATEKRSHCQRFKCVLFIYIYGVECVAAAVVVVVVVQRSLATWAIIYQMDIKSLKWNDDYDDDDDKDDDAECRCAID